jgi:hypothetical protein
VYPAVFSLRIKRQGLEADHSTPTSVEVNKAWIDISILKFLPAQVNVHIE